MAKTIFLLKAERDQREKLCSHVRDRIIPGLLAADPATLKVSMTDQNPPAISVIPFSRVPVACISVSGSGDFSGALDDDPFLRGTYRVDEALPVSYDVDWAMGEATPGCCLLTLFQKKKGLDHDTFIHRWHDGHTALTLRIHPLWNYVRNVVVDGRGEPFDGIVEEQLRRRSQLLNPLVFFGGPFICWRNMLVTWIDVRRFLEYSTLETYLATETWYRR